MRFLAALLALLAIAIFGGCTTVEAVRMDTVPVKRAVFRYAPQANPQREADHRAELDKQARAFCGGDFKIAREYQAREETGSSAGIGTGIGVGRNSSVFIGGSRPTTEMFQFVEVNCV